MTFTLFLWFLGFFSSVFSFYIVENDAGSVRLVSWANNTCQIGRVEVYDGNEWVTISYCDYTQSFYDFDDTSLDVICSELGFSSYSGSGSAYYGYNNYFSSTGDPYYNDDYQCGFEYSDCYSTFNDFCDDCLTSSNVVYPQFGDYAFVWCSYEYSDNTSYCHERDLYINCGPTQTDNNCYYSSTVYETDYGSGTCYSRDSTVLSSSVNSSSIAGWVIAIIVIAIIIAVCLPIIIVALVCGGVACCVGGCCANKNRRKRNNNKIIVTQQQQPITMPVQQPIQQQIPMQQTMYNQQPMMYQPMQQQQIQQPIVYNQQMMYQQPMQQQIQQPIMYNQQNMQPIQQQQSMVVNQNNVMASAPQLEGTEGNKNENGTQEVNNNGTPGEQLKSTNE